MATAGDYGHQVDNVSVPLVHIPLDCIAGAAACLVVPAFYLEEERTNTFLADGVPLYLDSTAGRSAFEPLVTAAVRELGMGRSRALGRLISLVPRLLELFPEALRVFIGEVEAGGRRLFESARRFMPKQRVSKALMDATERLELLRDADAMSAAGHSVYLEGGDSSVLLPRRPTSDWARLLAVAGDEDSAEALRKARQGRRRAPLFHLAVAVVPCRAHLGTVVPVPVNHGAPWLSIAPWDPRERLARQKEADINYFVDPSLGDALAGSYPYRGWVVKSPGGPASRNVLASGQG